MSLSVALQAALSGLRANQVGIDLVSRNVSNATTEGYTRKTVPQTPLLVGGQGAGVELGQVTRQVSDQLQRQVRQGLSQAANLGTIDDFLGRLELSFGKPGDNTSLGNAVSKLADSFRTLANSPESVTAQNEVIARAEELATTLNDLGDSVQALRSEAERGIADSVAKINGLLSDIEKLNAQIVTANSAGQSTADLEDQQDRKLDELSKEIGINYYRRDNGQITITTESGRTLLDGVAHQLQFNASAQVTSIAAYPGSLNGVTIDGIDLFQAPPVTPPMTEVGSGRLAALADLRDRILPQAELQLDELASVMTQQFMGLTPPLELFQDGGATYNVANITGYAQRISVNQTVVSQSWRLRDGTAAALPSTTTPSDGTLPRAVIDMFTAVQTFSGTTGLGTQFTFSQYGATFVGYQANQRQTASDRLSNQEAINDALTTRLTGESGVNVDQEMALMVQLQNAYSANARVVSAIKEMLDALLQIA